MSYFSTGSSFQAMTKSKKPKKGLAHDLPPGFEPGGRPGKAPMKGSRKAMPSRMPAKRSKTKKG